MNDEIKQLLIQLEYFIEEDYKYYNDIKLNKNEVKNLLDYITNLQQDNTMYAQLKDEYEEEIKDLQQKIEQYENPDDMTLFYMWLDAKAKDKIKELQQENERLKENNQNMQEEMARVWEENEGLKKENDSLNSYYEYYKNLADKQNTLMSNYKFRCEKAIEYNYELQERYCHSAIFDELVASKIYEITEKELNILQNGSEKDDK